MALRLAPAPTLPPDLGPPPGISPTWVDAELATAEREQLRRDCERDPQLRVAELAACARWPAYWIDRWVWTYDPRDQAHAWRPMVLYPIQRDLIAFIQGAVDEAEERIVEKSRDMGFSWVCMAYAVHHWLFRPGFKTTFGSWHADKVDKLGNQDSLLQKARMILEVLPHWQRPVGYKPHEHAMFMRIVNPVNGNTITGEVGSNMGRGGRSSCYVVDEAAFLEHALDVDRSVSANANARIWGSTANHPPNVFYEKVESGRYPRFRMHWRDHPEKDDAWAKATQAGLLPHVWAIEHDIDYSAAAENIVIPKPWIDAAIQLWQETAAEELTGDTVAGLDIGAGRAESVCATRQGWRVLGIESWLRPDSVDTAHTALDFARQSGARRLNYDSTGVGFATGAILARDEHERALACHGVNFGAAAPKNVKMPDGRTAQDTFARLKDYLWWAARERCQRSWELITQGQDHPLSDCLAIPPDDTLARQLNQPTWTRTMTGKITVDKAPAGTPSPDRADAVLLTLHEGPTAAPVIAPVSLERRSSVIGRA